MIVSSNRCYSNMYVMYMSRKVLKCGDGDHGIQCFEMADGSVLRKHVLGTMCGTPRLTVLPQLLWHKHLCTWKGAR